MRRLLLALAVVACWTLPAQAQNCVTINGITRCASPWQLYDTTVRSVSLPVFDLRQTWNSLATTFTGVRLNITDTNSATASLLLDLQVNGTSKFKVTKAGAVTAPGSQFVDAICLDATNQDTGISRSAAGLTKFTNCAATTYATIGSTGLLFPTDNTYDIGASGATRPRNLFLAGAMVGGSSITVPSGSGYALTNSGWLYGPTGVTGQFALTNVAISAGIGLDVAIDKSLKINDRTQTTGMELNVGSATLGTCTGGTITTGSHNFAGGYTGNTSGSCVVNFGTPNWTNAPFCLAMSIASTTHPRISAVSTSAMTVTGGVSGEAITFQCVGRIGT